MVVCGCWNEIELDAIFFLLIKKTGKKKNEIFIEQTKKNERNKYINQIFSIWMVELDTPASAKIDPTLDKMI